MSNTWKPNRFTLTATVLLLTLTLLAAAPAAAAPAGTPAADGASHLGPVWSGLISWSVGGWMGRLVEWVGNTWAAGGYSIDPDGQRVAASPPHRTLTPSRALSYGQGAPRAFR